jgi:hypothetical protein
MLFLLPHSKKLCKKLHIVGRINVELIAHKTDTAVMSFIRSLYYLLYNEI